jgi:hypothetical protein
LLTNAPTTFTSIFLLFLCVAVNSKAAPDFAGWQMLATSSVAMLYTLASCLMIGAIWGERWRIMKDESQQSGRTQRISSHCGVASLTNLS